MKFRICTDFLFYGLPGARRTLPSDRCPLSLPRCPFLLPRARGRCPVPASLPRARGRWPVPVVAARCPPTLSLPRVVGDDSVPSTEIQHAAVERPPDAVYEVTLNKSKLGQRVCHRRFGTSLSETVFAEVINHQCVVEVSRSFSIFNLSSSLYSGVR